MTQPFSRWLKNHPQDVRTLWALQNCLGSCFGWDKAQTKQAIKALEDAREKLCWLCERPAGKAKMMTKQPLCDTCAMAYFNGKNDAAIYGNLRRLS